MQLLYIYITVIIIFQNTLHSKRKDLRNNMQKNILYLFYTMPENLREFLHISIGVEPRDRDKVPLICNQAHNVQKAPFCKMYVCICVCNGVDHQGGGRVGGETHQL